MEGADSSDKCTCNEGRSRTVDGVCVAYWAGGVQYNLSETTLTIGGWRMCKEAAYNVPMTMSTAKEACVAQCQRCAVPLSLAPSLRPASFFECARTAALLFHAVCTREGDRGVKETRARCSPPGMSLDIPVSLTSTRECFFASPICISVDPEKFCGHMSLSVPSESEPSRLPCSSERLLFGAKRTGSSMLTLAAMGSSRINELSNPVPVTNPITYDTGGVTKIHNGIYWYMTQLAFGFSAVPEIALTVIDKAATNCSGRMSWSIEASGSGYRAGCTCKCSGCEAGSCTDEADLASTEGANWIKSVWCTS